MSAKSACSLLFLLLVCSLLSACSARRRLGDNVPVMANTRYGNNFFPKVMIKSGDQDPKVIMKRKKEVSWRLPHRKRGEKTNTVPGFNLDYSPPKTHPPSHN